MRIDREELTDHLELVMLEKPNNLIEMLSWYQVYKDNMPDYTIEYIFSLLGLSMKKISSFRDRLKKGLTNKDNAEIAQYLTTHTTEIRYILSLFVNFD